MGVYILCLCEEKKQISFSLLKRYIDNILMLNIPYVFNNLESPGCHVSFSGFPSNTTTTQSNCARNNAG